MLNSAIDRRLRGHKKEVLRAGKQEFMNFMEVEFARLDKNGDGELDVKELTQIQVRFRSPAHR
jgi:hypothetical protein